MPFRPGADADLVVLLMTLISSQVGSFKSNSIVGASSLIRSVFSVRSLSLLGFLDYYGEASVPIHCWPTHYLSFLKPLMARDSSSCFSHLWPGVFHISLQGRVCDTICEFCELM